MLVRGLVRASSNAFTALIANRARVTIPAVLLFRSLTRQGLLHPTLLSRLEVIRVSLHFPDDLFRLNLAFEPSQCIVQRLAFLQTHFCQIGSSSRAKVNQPQLQLTARFVVVLRSRHIWQHAWVVELLK